jgi:iron only hydrogenase large subunit-like protein
MNLANPIYTEINNCQDCYKCIRHCPVKGINVGQGSASIVGERCIFCGNCVTICPANAKKIRNDLKAARNIINNTKIAVASLAPSYATEFPNISISKITRALKMLGFSAVSETALGAEVVSKETASYISKHEGGIYISSACPSVVELICKYYPNLSDSIIPIHSPMVTHGMMIKEWFGKDAKTIFFGPCISKKREADKYKDSIDVALTFNDLRKWLDDEGIDFDLIPENEDIFEPYLSDMGSIYPLDGGMVAGISTDLAKSSTIYMNFSGTDAIRQTLNSIGTWNSNQKLFLELLSCTGGCIHGPGTLTKDSTAIKRYKIQSELIRKNTRDAKAAATTPSIDISRSFSNIYPVIKRQHAEADLLESLSSIGKQSEKDEINCGGCGYDSCRDFAAALIDGQAERNMCVSYMRKVANDKATVLLQKIPSGVLLVDEEMKVVESNKSFAKMMGAEIEMINEANPGLAGANVAKLVPFHKLFSSVLSTGKDIMERDVRFSDKFFKVSIFTVQKHKIVCAIMRDLVVPEVRNDEIVKRTQKVIQENLETVQKIAYLLGENASRTETMLNTILEAYQIEESSER